MIGSGLPNLEQVLDQASKPGGSPVAFLEWQGRVLYTRAPLAVTPHEPSSAVVCLIQALYEQFPDKARMIARRRIFATEPPTEMSLGMVRVAAKRISWARRWEELPEEARQFGGLPAEEIRFENQAGLFGAEELPEGLRVAGAGAETREWMRLALELAGARGPSDDAPLYERDRAVVALLISGDGTLLGWARNTNARNRTLHAEVNLVQGYYRRFGTGLPAGARVVTSLKPCKMCAGMLWHAAVDVASLQVFFGEWDLGPNARETVLNPGTFERRRAAGATGGLPAGVELGTELEWHFPG